MLTTPFKEGSEPGYKIMLFPEGEMGSLCRNTEVSKQCRAGSVLQLSSGSRNILFSEPCLFPCRTNTDQPGLLFITGEEAIEKELNLWL